ncbi:MAG TPA: hypothetical protein VMV05_06325 [bacterium]|nr:hypothetical protein [bacterium]
MNLLFGVDQDFHRPQTNPGAYEWWHFDGTDDQSGYSFVIQFHAGNLFSAYYQDSLKTYWEKTKSPLVDSSLNPASPNPLDYGGVSFRLFHKGRMVVESLQEFSQKSLKASDKHGAVLLGPNRFNWDERGDPPSYVLTVQAPGQGGKSTLRARLFFTPRSFRVEDNRDPDGDYFSTHTWVLAAPVCHVEGTLEWVTLSGDTKKEVAFVGKGYHDHHFGTVPLDRFVKSWHWGHQDLGGVHLLYSVQIPHEKNGAPLVDVISIHGNQAQVWDVNIRLPLRARNLYWTPYEKRLESPRANDLRITHGQTLCPGPALSVFRDNSEWTFNGKHVGGPGLSHHLYTPRLSSRFFFPLLKGKSLIIKSSEDTELPPPSEDVSTTRPMP